MSSRAALLAFLMVAGHASAGAQCAPQQNAALPLFVNDEAEVYARVQQTAGDVPLYPWSNRNFGWRESCARTKTDTSSYWKHTHSAATAKLGPVRAVALPVQVTMIGNTAFPYGANDGPVWVGRGLTTSASLGFGVWSRFVSLVVAPTAFRAENARFTLGPNGMTGSLAFGDAFAARQLDMPQRFGDAPYQRLSPGNSTLRIDAVGVTLGFSTANQHWGPARDNPLVLGSNAEGYPHAFVGTSRPLSIGIGRAHTRIHWGRLTSTPYTIARDEGRFRFATGLVAVFEPRGLEGLELGFSRYFHLRWSDSVLTNANFGRPFIGIVRNSRIDASGNTQGDEPDNQVASLFARWVFPRAGLELYAEAGRDDYNADVRDLVMEPDHISAYLFGFQRVLHRNDGGYLAVRGELANARITALQLNRMQAPFYVHAAVAEGHTNYGQVLGAPAANGGGGAVIAVDRYRKSGRTTIAWTRTMRQEYRLNPIPEPHKADVFQALSFSGVRLHGRTAITYEVTGVLELNRFFGRDATNLRAALGVQQALW